MSLEAKLHVDGELIETARWPTEFTTRRFYLVLALRARRGTPRGRSAATEPNVVGAGWSQGSRALNTTPKVMDKRTGLSRRYYAMPVETQEFTA